MCQLDLQRIADYISSSKRFTMKDNIRCWQNSHLHMIEHSVLYLSLSLCIYPTENIQTSAGDHPSNTGECQAPHHWPAKTYFQLFVATPTDSGQWNFSPSGSELHCPLSVGVAPYLLVIHSLN